MSAEQNRATYHRFVDEVINRGNFAVGEELLSPEFVDHTPQPGQSPDRAGYLEVFRQFRSAFPDLTVTVDALVCDGDLVAGRGTSRGTHSGPLPGPAGPIAATGKTVTVSYMNFIRLQNGVAVETWTQQDLLSMLTQLGVLPSPEQPPA